MASQLQKILGSDTLLDKAERVITGNPWQAYVKISDGCSNRCAYCAIPLIRGDQKSRTIEDIMEEVNHLASIGVKELTLIAQDTTKYGLDNYGELMLPELLRQVSKVEGLHWIRVLYMYPDEIVDDVLQAMSESEKIVPYFDIPMQHANNRLLKLMNRRGPKEDVLKVVDKIHAMFPNATLRTTMIVGFPTETEEEFEELVDFIISKELIQIGDPVNLGRLYKEIISKDWFMALLDIKEYIAKKEQMLADYEDETTWAKKALVNIAKAGYFSADRTIAEYNEDIWKLS